MKRILILIVVLLPMSPAHAVPVKVQSGEHDGFTRLVFEMPEKATQWAVSGQGRTYEMEVFSEDVEFSTNSVFSRITRSRLATVSTKNQENKLILELNCDCRIRSRPFGEQYVILDIFDPPTSVGRREQSDYSFGLEPAGRSQGRQFRFAQADDKLPKRLARPVSDVIGEALSPARFMEREASLKVSLQELIQEFGRAVSLEVLEAVPPTRPQSRPEDSGEQYLKAENSAVYPTETSMQAEADRRQALSNMSTYSETTLFSSGQPNDPTESGTRCLPAEDLDISAWADDTPISEQLSSLRSRLYREFDQVDQKTAKQLARLYIHFSFGAEARQVLSLTSLKGAETLKALSKLVEGRTPVSSVLAAQAGCSGLGSFWAVLADADVNTDENVQGVVKTFNDLPRHLREYFAPRLSTQLAELDYVEAAELVLKAVERVTPDPEAGLQIARANVARAQNDQDAAFRSLIEVSGGNSELTPRALIDLIDLHVEQQLPPAEDLIALVGAFAVELGPAPIGAELRRAHFLARLEGSQFSEALSVLREIEGTDGVASADPLRDTFGLRMAERAGDFEFVALMVQNELTQPENFSSQVSLTLATRFFELGFLQESQKMLQYTKDLTGSPDRRKLLARFALGENSPRRAEAALLGMDDDVANKLRAEARRMAGDYLGAMEIYENLGDSAEADRQAWLQSDWPALASSDTEVYRRLSELVGAPAESGIAGQTDLLSRGVLSRNRDLLDGSAVTRNVLGELLELHSRPVVSGG